MVQSSPIGWCKDKNNIHNPVENGGKAVENLGKQNENFSLEISTKALYKSCFEHTKKVSRNFHHHFKHFFSIKSIVIRQKVFNFATYQQIVNR